MAPKAKASPDYIKWGVTCLPILGGLCAVFGCLLTFFFYQAGDYWPREGETVMMGNIINALFYVVPIVTAVVVIAMLLTAVSMWIFDSPQHSTGNPEKDLT